MSGWTLHNQGADAVTHQYSLHCEDGIHVLLDVLPQNPRAKEDLALIAAAPQLLEALTECQKTLAILIDPANKGSGISNMAVWASCVASESVARHALASATPEKEGGE